MGNERKKQKNDKSIILMTKSPLRKVFFAQIAYTGDQTGFLQHELLKQWKIPQPEAIIAITGVGHQFNIKDKLHLKRDLIDAVINTESWIVTCGIEEGVVRFIQDAVDEHIALEEYHIPIVGILSKRVLDEMSKTNMYVEKINTSGRLVRKTLMSTKEPLDPNYTQFVFIDDEEEPTISKTTTECKNAFKNFLSNIGTKNLDPKTQTADILPVVMVLIEGGIEALKTANKMLEQKIPVVVIDGSGGAANFLAACYRCCPRDDEPENSTELFKKCFGDSLFTDDALNLSKSCLKNKKLIYMYSLEDTTAKVDMSIQNAMFDIYKGIFENQDKRNRSVKKTISAIQTQLKLVERWNRCDLAATHIFIDKNRSELSELQKKNSQYSVLKLFQSSLFKNRADFVSLVMARIDNMREFVYVYLPEIYRECCENTKEYVAIQLFKEQWENEGKTNIDSDQILCSVTDFIRNVLGDTHFKMYELKKENESIKFHDDDRPFYHLFVWAIFMNRKEIANIFLKKDTDYTASALFGSAILKELADRAFFLNHIELSDLLKENARYFETLSCNLMRELYRNERDRALKIVVNTVHRYKCTPIEIASSQNMMNFMATSACQAKLNRIWRGDITLHTQDWRIWMAVVLPVLIIPKFGFITYEKKGKTSSSVKPSKSDESLQSNSSPNENQGNGGIFSCISWFYSAPEVKFVLYMITYFTFVVIFSIFVLTDLHPLSETLPSVFEYMTWMWTLSLAIEEIRQILQTNKGSFTRNIMFWAKNVWNIFDALMYLLFLVSVMLRCILRSDDFYYARMTYAITLAMFIFRTMQFFFVTRYLGPKVVMIGKMIGDLAFFFALFALFVFSFGIMYQAVLFPNSVLPPWELFKQLIYLPYWQLYGELNLDQIEGKEPSECTNNPVLYSNGTMIRCPQTNQFNSPILAAYLILTNIVLLNLLIAMFSYTFERVQENSEIIWKFHRYALVYEYYDRPMFPIPILIHFTRLIVWSFYTIRKKSYDSPFAPEQDEEKHKLHIVENKALAHVDNINDTSNMMADRRDINAETESTRIRRDIEDLKEEIRRLPENVIMKIKHCFVPLEPYFPKH